MCGIIGYIGKNPCLDLIFEGLKKLEYRGYDSSGVAIIDENNVKIVKSEGKLSNLRPLLNTLSPHASVGMGHTRWATHGPPSTQNAHPHMKAGLAIIHNGILENYKELKIKLFENGQQFSSDTDSEVIVHLLEEELHKTQDMKKALKNLIPVLEGAYALGILWEKEPDAIYLVKQGSPLVVGVGHGENFFASDALALLKHVQHFHFMEDGEVAQVTAKGVEFYDFALAPLNKEPTLLKASAESAQKGLYRHYMLKEIHDQPQVVQSTIQRIFPKGTLDVDALGIAKLQVDSVKRIHILACGTAYYAGLLGKYILEPSLKIPVDVELASEFRYRNPYLDASTLVIAVTQSGETADTLACVKHAKKAGCQLFSICNVEHSSIPRLTKEVLYMGAGAEIGVASTKAFTSMLLNIYLLSLGLKVKLGLESANAFEKELGELRKLPNLIERVLGNDQFIANIAGRYFEERNCLFIGRGVSFPIAYEGALKLKEISYIHAEGYAGGELKHGPIALIDKHMPVVAIVPKDENHGKMLSNIEEIRARDGRVLGIGAQDDERLRSLCDSFIPCPQIANPALQGILSVIPLQLFSYHMAVLRGTDVDQPRNLAKSVTVE